MEISVDIPKTTASWSLPMEEVRLLPIGDLQYGTDGFDRDRFERHISWGMDVGAYFVGMGDYCLPEDARILTRRGFKKHAEAIIG